MITSAITVLRPAAPGIAPGTALPAGPTGPSAYQVAVAAGYTGTAAQWLASLIGPPADPTALNNATSAAQAALTALQNANPLPNTVAALLTLMTTMLQGLPTSPSAAGPSWWNNAGQPTYS